MAVHFPFDLCLYWARTSSSSGYFSCTICFSFCSLLSGSFSSSPLFSSVQRKISPPPDVLLLVSFSGQHLSALTVIHLPYLRSTNQILMLKFPRCLRALSPVTSLLLWRISQFSLFLQLWRFSLLCRFSLFCLFYGHFFLRYTTVFPLLG